MVTVRWVLFALFLFGLVPAFLGVRSWVLFGFLLVVFLGLVWSLRPWAERIGPDHPDTFGSLDLVERHGPQHR